MLLPGKPHHNPYINQCVGYGHHSVYMPSQIYRFNQLKETVTVSDHTDGYSHNPHECGIVIQNPDPSVMKCVLQACQQISCQQKVTNLYLILARCGKDIKVEEEEGQEWQVFNLSPNCEKLILQYCIPLPQTICHLISQIQSCPYLTVLCFRESLQSQELCTRVCKQLEDLVHLKILILTANPLGSSGLYLAESIQEWGPKPLLEKLILNQCEMPEEACAAVLSALSLCAQIKDLQLNDNTIGAAGVCFAKSIQSWGPEPSLEILYLDQCEIQEEASKAVLSALSTCKQMTNLHLDNNTLGAAGDCLAKSIQAWGPEPPLAILGLDHCEMPEEAWSAVLSALSSCKWLKILWLARNTLGAAGAHLSESIRGWGPEPPLEELDLEQCQMPQKTWAAVLSVFSFSFCNKLKVKPSIDMAGVHIADVILAWEAKVLLSLDLMCLQIAPPVWTSVLQALSSCKKLKQLWLNNNTIGAPGVYLAESILTWGPEPPLEKLSLEQCDMSEEAWVAVLSALSSCKLLKELCLSDDTFGEAGVHVAHLIEAWGPEHPLQRLDLDGCQMPEEGSAAVLKALSFLKQLKELWLDRNTVGTAGVYLAESIQAWGPEPPLVKLH